jgi:glyoxylase-like metal-dependent hydrolase (beta-lactamase superfamily II)
VAPVSAENSGEVLEGVWRFEARHPEWTEDEGGEEGWDPIVSWWALSTPAGIALIDPLIDDWVAIDELVRANGGCAGIIRSCHWHQRSIAEAAVRYHAQVWAAPHSPEGRWPSFDGGLSDRQELFDRIVVLEMERDDEVALWLPTQRALLFGDAMLRGATGRLQVCPESWTQPEAGRARLEALLRELTELPVEHVLVSHGPLVLGDGLPSLRAATS